MSNDEDLLADVTVDAVVSERRAAAAEAAAIVMDSGSQPDKETSSPPPVSPLLLSDPPVSLIHFVYPESIENLSKNLKQYDAKVDDDIEYRVVSQFNPKLLLQICLPSSPMYDNGIDIDVLC